MIQQNNFQKEYLNSDEENILNEAISYSRLVAQLEEQEQSVIPIPYLLLNKNKSLPVFQQYFLNELSKQAQEDSQKINFFQRQTEKSPQADNRQQKTSSNNHHLMLCSSPSFTTFQAKPMISSQLRPIPQTENQHKRSEDEAYESKTFLESQIIIKNKLNNLSSIISHRNRLSLTKNQTLPRNKLNQTQAIQLNKRQLDDSVELITDPKILEGLKIEKQSKQTQKRVISSQSTATKLFGKKEEFANLIRTVQNVENTLMTMRRKKSFALSQQKRSSISRNEQNYQYNKSGTESNFHNLSVPKNVDKYNKSNQKDYNSSTQINQLSKLARDSLWIQLLSSRKSIKSSLKRSLQFISKKIKLPERYKVYSEQPLTVLYENGKMIQVSYSQKVYIGQYKNIKGILSKHGKGMQIDPSRSIYQGSFRQGLKEGLGKILIINKYTYDGEWKAGIMQGKGIIQTNGKSTYQGQIMKGKKHGYGIELLNSGDIYEGYFQNNVFHGKGLYSWRSGASYKGDFMNGQMHGQAKWVSEHGDIYKGSFVNGKKQGKGVYSWKNGKKFEGYFKNGSRVSIASSKNLYNKERSDIQSQKSSPSPKKFKIYF